MKVLLVDDEEDIRKIAKLSLEAIGHFETRAASSGTSALEEAQRDRPDVVLMDMMMPEMDGLAVLAQMKKSAHLRDIPVIFMTAKVQPEELQRYLEAGGQGVIQKPFDPMTLSAEVVRILEGGVEKRT